MMQDTLQPEYLPGLQPSNSNEESTKALRGEFKSGHKELRAAHEEQRAVHEQSRAVHMDRGVNKDQSVHEGPMHERVEHIDGAVQQRAAHVHERVVHAEPRPVHMEARAVHTEPKAVHLERGILERPLQMERAVHVERSVHERAMHEEPRPRNMTHFLQL